MCFSPKIKTPSVNTSQAMEPEPIKDEPAGILFGGSDDEKDKTTGEVSKSGRSSLKISKSPSPAATRSKSATRKSIFNK